ncbi:hypothetical protein NP493_893g01063 [Ridgeia piscesae]|uniref:Uncharacterized protein n=1 Tax=Ridgeia piscesae TaxID=27915 RepID=A0AAD9KKV7_RIDPI|nr:hypothetical protein NP493_893g01063 [Ridgeia piscesae]
MYIQRRGDGVNGVCLAICEVEVFAALAVATGYRDYGDCAVFTDHNRSTCGAVTSATSPLDFVLRTSLMQSRNEFDVSVILRDGDCADSSQVHVYTEQHPLELIFSGYYRRCHLAESAAPVDGATVCQFHCLCTSRPCDFVFVRVFGRFGPVRSLCEVELL